MGWANRLTVARAGLAVFLWGILAAIGNGHEENLGLWWAAFAVFAVAAGTDSLDGYVARRLNEVSQFGRVADPFVDKMLILGSLVFLLSIPDVRTLMPPWVAVVILMRELLVTALRGAVEGQGGNFQAGPWGKVKMATQCAAVAAVLLHGAGIAWLRTPFPAVAGAAALPGELTWPWFFSALAALVTAGSGVEYTVRAVAVLRNGPRA